MWDRLKIENGFASDEQVLFLSDIFPTGYMAAENAEIEQGDTVAVWGCGPVAQFAIQSAWMLGAGRVIAIDRVPERLRHGAEAWQSRGHQLRGTMKRVRSPYGDDGRPRTGPLHRRGGREAHGAGSFDAVLRQGQGRGLCWRPTARMCCARRSCAAAKAARSRFPGVYIGIVDKIPIGAAMNKGLTLEDGPDARAALSPQLLEKIEAGEIDPSFVVTHTPAARGGSRRFTRPSATRRTAASRSC